jgi:hypothetical protein
MTKKFGAAYTSVSKQYRGPGSKFMRSFESAKRNYSGPSDTKIIEIDTLNMPDAPNSQHYDKQELVIRLTGYVPHATSYWTHYLQDISDELRSIIDPVITDVIKLVEQQVANAREKKGQKIEASLKPEFFGITYMLMHHLTGDISGRRIRRLGVPKP